MNITASKLTKQFGSRVLWKDLSFSIPSGQLVAITGANGCGKTTLLNCIGRLQRFNSGTLALNEQIVTGDSKRVGVKFFREDVGFLFQNYGLVSEWTVAKNLELALKYQKHSRKQRNECIAEVLQRVDLGGLEAERILQLSGGEQQRVALARVLLKSPKLILADEPSSAVDSTNTALVMEILRDCSTKGSTVLISTHDPKVVTMCDRVLNL